MFVLVGNDNGYHSNDQRGNHRTRPCGNAIILAGDAKFEKGRLLERNARSGKGAIQLFEDMNVVTLSLDDIVEYCVALDDALA